MTAGRDIVPFYVWLTPALIASFLYGLGQGLVKKCLMLTGMTLCSI